MPPSESMPSSTYLYQDTRSIKSEPLQTVKVLTTRAANYCNTQPAFGFFYYNEDPNSIVFWDQPTAKRLKSRSKVSFRMTDTSTPSNPLQPSNRPRGEIIYSTDKRLVLSNDAQHSATDLCASPDSLGPDFVNTATDQFCKMSDKTLHPYLRS